MRVVATVTLVATAFAVLARYAPRVEGGAVALAAVPAAGDDCRFIVSVQDESESGQPVRFGSEYYCGGTSARRAMVRIGDHGFALGPLSNHAFDLMFSEARYSDDARHWLVFGSGENGEPGHWRHLYRSDDGGDSFVEIDVPRWSWRVSEHRGELSFSGAAFNELCVEFEVPKTVFDRVSDAWTSPTHTDSRGWLLKAALFDGYCAYGTHTKPSSWASHDGGRSWSRRSSACAGGEASPYRFVGGFVAPKRHRTP